MPSKKRKRPVEASSLHRQGLPSEFFKLIRISPLA
jgi:hypothetical protein